MTFDIFKEYKGKIQQIEAQEKKLRGGGSTSRTTQNHYFVATEHDPEAAKGGEGTAQGFTWATPWPEYFWAKRTQQNTPFVSPADHVGVN